MVLKCDFHMHVGKNLYNYDEQLLVKTYAQLGYDAISITNHDWIGFENVFSSIKKARHWGRRYGVNVIPGVEKTLRGKHILCYGDIDGLDGVNTFGEFMDFKRSHNMLVIAPHPAYVFDSVFHRMATWHKAFDALEHCYAYLSWLNPNVLTQLMAKVYDKPLVANGDVHHLSHIDRNYSLIDADCDQDSIFRSIRKGRVDIVTQPLSWPIFCKYLAIMYHNDVMERSFRKQKALLNRNLAYKQHTHVMRLNSLAQFKLK